MNKIKFATKLGLSAAAVAFLTAKASALTVITMLGVIVVPPTQTASPGVKFLNNGSNNGYYEFSISQSNTIVAGSFTNTAVGKTGLFNFTSIGLYSGLGTGGSLLEGGTIGTRAGGTLTAFVDPYTLGTGSYTIAYSGMVKGRPASVGSSITFAAGAIPEPGVWMLMVAGFGLVGFSTRRRGKVVAA